jgi:hypothetical protein
LNATPLAGLSSGGSSFASREYAGASSTSFATLSGLREA